MYNALDFTDSLFCRRGAHYK